MAGTTDALGGGIFNNGGDMALDHVALTGNAARGGNGPYTFSGTDGHNAQGGGIYSTGGSLVISDSTLTTNQAIGGLGVASYPGGQGGVGQGGGLYVPTVRWLFTAAPSPATRSPGAAAGTVVPALPPPTTAAGTVARLKEVDFTPPGPY
jgi:hypothetical protein